MSKGGRAQEVPIADAQVGAPEDYAPGNIGLQPRRLQSPPRTTPHKNTMPCVDK